MQKPTKMHLELEKRVFRYLKHTLQYQLYFEPVIEVYRPNDADADADYANDLTTNKSINGMCTILFNCVIEWSSRKQSHISTSTYQAELVSIVDGVYSVIYLKNLLSESDNYCYQFTVFNDNTGAIPTCLKSGDFAKNKQYRIKVNYVMERIRER